MDNRTGQQQYDHAHRTREALELRRAGLTYEEIGRKQGVSGVTAWNRIHKALADIPKEAADELRQLECARLDRIQAAYWDAALSGDVSATDRVLKVIAQRCRLLGLDLPQRVEVSTADVDLDGAVSRIMALIDMQIQTANEET